MADLAALVKRRGIIKSTVTNIKKFVDKINSELEAGQAINREQLETRVEKLNEAWNEFHDIENQILLVPGQNSEAEEFEDKYFETKSTLKRIFNIRNPSIAPGPSNMSRDRNTTAFADRSFYQANELRLPRVSIESFSGDYTKWPSFSDQFKTTIHENESLSNIHKYQYLKGLLKGDAANLIRHLPISDATYEQAWDKLQKRYDKKRSIVKDLIELFLSQPPMKQCSHKLLRGLCDTSDEVLRGLAALGREWNSRDPWLIHIIVKKLDSETQQLWAQHVNDIDAPIISELLDFLTNRCDALESCSAVKSSPSFRSNPDSKSHSATVNRLECPMCKKSHHLHQCFNFKRLKTPNRRQFIEDHKLCINCLQPDHDGKSCQNAKRCFKCHQKHHTLIHVRYTDKNQESNNSETMLNALGTNIYQSTPLSTYTDSTISNTNNALYNNKIETCSSEISTISRENKSSSTVSPLQNFHVNPQSQNNKPNLPFSLPNALKLYKTLLSTILVNIADPYGKIHTIRALLDSGSQSTFINERCVQRIGIPRKHARFAVSGLGSKRAGSTRGAVELELRSRYDKRVCVTVNAFILAQLTSQLPSHNIDFKHWAKIKDLQLADPAFNTPGEIDMIMGNDIPFEIILPKQLRIQEGLFAHQTSFGWVLGGRYNQPTPIATLSGFHTNVIDNDAELKMLQRFWEMEELKSDNKHSAEEDYCESHYIKTTKRDQTGRYVVRLPFKETNKPIEFGRSCSMAIKRQLAIEKRFAKNDYLRENYINFMEEYISLNHMVAVAQTQTLSAQNQFYLPHHAVLKESSSTTKLRVVFDGSCKNTFGVSLNDSLLVGPTVQRDLMATLLHYRTHAVAITADIEKMYRQVLIHPDDRDFQRIVWRNSANDEMQHYQLNTVTYGTSSAAFLAVRTLHQLAMDYKTIYPEAASILLTNFYVDDMLTGCETTEQAANIYRSMSALLAKGGFKIRKWMSNDQQFLRHIPPEDRETSNLELEPNSTIKTLGCHWNPLTDTFCFRVNLPNTEKCTKRVLLSQASRIFDPMGWLSPLTISIKILFQSLWLLGLSWDDELPLNVAEKWYKIKDSMKEIEKITIPRQLMNNTNKNLQLHAFSDASELAYGAVVYSKVKDKHGSVNIRLLAAKTRVAPIKQVSLPRLELCAALLLVRLVRYIAQYLGSDTASIHAYTDSTIVLAWLDDHPRRWKNFIANRTSEILEYIPRKQWSHISSKQNPADLASRGLTSADLVTNTLWWSGPDGLSKGNYPISSVNNSSKGHDQNDLEERNSYKSFHIQISIFDVVSTLFSRFSSISKIYRIIAYIYRFITNAKTKSNRSVQTEISYRHVTSPTIDEIKQAETICIKWAQAEAFSRELKALNSKEDISKGSKLLPLTPFLDTSGVLRVGGRIENSTCSFDTKHPIILPREHRLSKLIIDDSHKQNLHAGPALLTSLLRQRFWILGCRNMTRHHVAKCLICFKQKTLRNEQLMGNLPKVRVSSGRPFLHTGVDYAGPLYLRERSGRGQFKITKGYIALFICMSVKAIHIELVSDMSTENFITALKRFISRRGIPIQIYSDNGSNFIGSRRELNELYELFKNESHFELISHFLIPQRIQFIFNQHRLLISAAFGRPI